MFELATALFWFRDEPDYDELAAALMDGYRARRPLPERELAALPLFTMARGFTYLGWVHTRRGTEVARELTPIMVEIVCQLADEFLASR
jgi:Ser/Thr protein kinase RdoA (MazF antagonist)